MTTCWLCREFARATRKVINEASHAGTGGNRSFLSACARCCPGFCGSKLQPQAGTKDYVSPFLGPSTYLMQCFIGHDPWSLSH